MAVTAETAAVLPISIEVSDAELEDMCARILATRWPDEETVDDQSQVTPMATAKTLANQWATDCDWRRREARFSSFPHVFPEIDGLAFHFLPVRSPQVDALPVVVGQSRPGSVVEAKAQRLYVGTATLTTALLAFLALMISIMLSVQVDTASRRGAVVPDAQDQHVLMNTQWTNAIKDCVTATSTAKTNQDESIRDFYCQQRELASKARWNHSRYIRYMRSRRLHPLFSDVPGRPRRARRRAHRHTLERSTHGPSQRAD
jgi:hypothetical protein